MSYSTFWLLEVNLFGAGFCAAYDHEVTRYPSIRGSMSFTGEVCAENCQLLESLAQLQRQRNTMYHGVE